MNPVALIDTAEIGDWDGYGGLYNVENNVSYADGSPIANDIHMVCSMGGGIGDLSWLEAGDVPMCAVHCPTDPVAIYTTGDVAVSQIELLQRILVVAMMLWSKQMPLGITMYWRLSTPEVIHIHWPHKPLLLQQKG